MRKVFNIILILCLIPFFASADTICFKDGMKIEVMSTWEENGQIKCKMAGVIIGYPKEDIERILKTPVNKSVVYKKKDYPVHTTSNENRTCYELGKSFGYCATLSLHGKRCAPQDDVSIPERCKHNSDTDKGNYDGVSLAFKVLGLPSGTDGLDSNTSYNQVMANLSGLFYMEKSTPVRKQQRYMGKTKDGLAVLETIGDKNDLAQASIILGFPKDAPKISYRNSAILLRFLKNTVPEWNDSPDWATNSLKQLPKHPDSTVETFKGEKQIKMQLIRDLGLITTTVKFR